MTPPTTPVLYARPDGYCLPTVPANPDAWTAAVVAAVLAAPEAVSTNDWAATRAKLGSDVTTTLTLT